MPQTILITGASGFIGAWVVNSFLEAGYHVKAAVRSESSWEKVKKPFAKYSTELTHSIVPDITKESCYDDAIKGVDGVIHLASPFVLDAKDYTTELWDPALNGTTAILKATKDHAPQVKRVVIISSFAAIIDVNKGLRPDHTYTEADWMPMTRDDAHAAGPAAAYLVSKTEAERAAWDFVEKEKPNFSVTTLCPPMVYGPILHAVDSMDKLNTSSADIYRLINGAEKEVPETSFWGYIDVRDVAAAHLKAYEDPKAAGERYLISAGNYSYQKFVTIMKEKFPEMKDALPKDREGEAIPPVYKMGTEKSIKGLGMVYKPMEETVVDTVTSLKALEKALA